MFPSEEVESEKNNGRHRGWDGEEAQRQQGRDWENSEIELGFGREGQAVVYKESCFAHAKVEGMMVGLPQGNGGYGCWGGGCRW